MKPSIPKIVPQYITDAKGNKTGVILDIKTFNLLLEEMEDMYLGSLAEVALQDASEALSHEDIKKKLLKD